MIQKGQAIGFILIKNNNNNNNKNSKYNMKWQNKYSKLSNNSKIIKEKNKEVYF